MTRKIKLSARAQAAALDSPVPRRNGTNTDTEASAKKPRKKKASAEPDASTKKTRKNTSRSGGRAETALQQSIRCNVCPSSPLKSQCKHSAAGEAFLKKVGTAYLICSRHSFQFSDSTRRRPVKPTERIFSQHAPNSREFRQKSLFVVFL